MNAGDAIPELKVTPDKYLTVRYAGASGDFNPIHIDEEFAKQVGLPGRILHGLWTMAQVARAQTEAGGGPHSAQAARACSSAAWACPSRRSRSRATVARGRATASRSSTPRPSRTASEIIRSGEARSAARRGSTTQAC